MSLYGTSAREHLIEIQRQHVARLQAEIEQQVEPLNPELAQAYAVYEGQFEGALTPVTREGFLADLAGLDVVYFGDYHTLRESQKAPLRVLSELIARGRRVLIATEAVHLTHQDHLDAHLAGTLDDETFQQRSDYPRNWGFPWRNFKLQLDFARAHGIPMRAINSDPAVVGNKLRMRDAIAAMLIVEALMRDPGRLVAVVFGDLHVCPAHLPAEVDRFTASRLPGPLRSRVVFQNADRVYWQLAEQGLEQTTEVVRLQDDNYCLVNSTPLVKYQSYFNWEFDAEELEESHELDDPRLDSTVLTDQVHELTRAIAGFLELPTDDLDDFSVHTFRDLNFLDELRASGHYGGDELAELQAQIERDDSYFLVRDRIIYLGNLSVDHAAEEATHYLNTKLAGHVEFAPSPGFDFYYRALKEAIGFLGSRIVNHKRPCFKRQDFERILVEFRGRRNLRPDQQQKRSVATDVLRHLDHEAAWLQGAVRGYPRFRKLYERPLAIRVGTTHALGYMLGHRIHQALVGGHLHKQEVRAMFRERFASEPRPREAYFDWLDYLRGAPVEPGQ